MTERRRRQDLTQKFIALAATIPGLKKMDKATVLCAATDYVKRLQERVRELAQEAVEVPEMEVRVLENEVLVRVQCEGRRDMMRKTVELLGHVHLSVLCCNSLAFGNSALSITIVAQMKDQYKMKVNKETKEGGLR
ncbi:transcription factor bHLH19-like [Neltuma alba]|uniref:transcription factor bHLH19-like n=1 Tax=Neltuma alba TaxID=207710 RepID=UPI0010A467FE|nr:transcription factor bHLH19-like [Prosopis alba]